MGTWRIQYKDQGFPVKLQNLPVKKKKLLKHKTNSALLCWLGISGNLVVHQKYLKNIRNSWPLHWECLHSNPGYRRTKKHSFHVLRVTSCYWANIYIYISISNPVLSMWRRVALLRAPCSFKIQKKNMLRYIMFV